MLNPGAYFETHKVELEVGASPWVILSPERQRIKELVEAQGVPLEKWDINIYRGVLTGFNKAFYITNDEKRTFELEDPSCADILVKLLTGADIKRYGVDWDETWMIVTFPSKGLDFDSLPKPIQRRLKSYQPQLTPKPRDWWIGT